jgi:hypothetical protein
MSVVELLGTIEGYEQHLSYVVLSGAYFERVLNMLLHALRAAAQASTREQEQLSGLLVRPVSILPSMIAILGSHANLP